MPFIFSNQTSIRNLQAFRQIYFASSPTLQAIGLAVPPNDEYLVGELSRGRTVVLAGPFEADSGTVTDLLLALSKELNALDGANESPVVWAPMGDHGRRLSMWVFAENTRLVNLVYAENIYVSGDAEFRRLSMAVGPDSRYVVADLDTGKSLILSGPIDDEDFPPGETALTALARALGALNATPGDCLLIPMHPLENAATTETPVERTWNRWKPNETAVVIDVTPFEGQAVVGDTLEVVEPHPLLDAGAYCAYRVRLLKNGQSYQVQHSDIGDRASLLPR